MKEPKKEAAQKSAEKFSSGSIVMIELSKLWQGPNYRDEGTPEALAELVESIKANGVLQSIIVRKKENHYEIIAGARRFKASQIAGQEKIPAMVVEANDERAAMIQFVENCQRKDAHAMEEARGLLAIYKSGVSIEQICLITGKSRAYIGSRMRLCDLSKEWQDLFLNGRIPIHTALELCKIEKSAQGLLYKNNQRGSGVISLNGWDFKQVSSQLALAPFALDDALLVKKAGACTVCPHNSASGNLFPDTVQNAVCGKVECYKEKCAVHLQKTLERVAQDPTIILVSADYGSKKKAAGALDRSDYEELDKPEPLDMTDFDRSNYDSEQEMKEDIDRQQKVLDRQMKEYEKKKASGSYTPAVIVDGSNAGRETLVLVKAKGKSKAAKPGAVANAAEIKDQIQRIREREKRAKELDFEKVSSKIFDILGKSNFLQKEHVPIDSFQSLWWKHVYDHVLQYPMREKFRRTFKKHDEQKFTPEQKSWLVKHILFHAHGSEFGEPRKGASYLREMAALANIDSSKLIKEQKLAAEARAERVKKRISDLTKLLKK